MILVVEDQDKVREQVLERLKQEGYETIWAAHGGAAMSIMRVPALLKKIKAIVLDQEMTEYVEIGDYTTKPKKKDESAMDGDEFVRQCLIEGIKVPPIVLHSGSFESFFQWMHDELKIKRSDYMKMVKGFETIKTELEFKNEENDLHVVTADKTSPKGLNRVIKMLKHLGIEPDVAPSHPGDKLEELAPGTHKKHVKPRNARKREK